MIRAADHAAHEGDLPRLPEQPDRRRARSARARGDRAASPSEHDLLVYSDEIYDRLVYGDHEHTAFSSLPAMRERTVLLGGFSKSYAMTGWRIGYVAAPAELMAGIAKVHQYGIMCAPTARPVRRDRGAAQRRAASSRRCTPSTTAAAASSTDRFNEIGLADFEPKGAFYCFPHVTDATGLDDDGVRRAAAGRGARRGRARDARSGRRAPATSGSATPPPTRRSSRRWTGSSASWDAIGRDATDSAAPSAFSRHRERLRGDDGPGARPGGRGGRASGRPAPRRDRPRRRHRDGHGRAPGARATGDG